ncbi:hypothetical protein KZX45_15445 [Georgenia sp. EYE_87]|uniref:DUF6668 family protein n=1 Tax=Georgenia sp. EYE_87 TaxID=2853448 RepID=UPI0020031B73|nr:DUF6668 family protein [Georgenia sp. EYE_87]MCK6211939.1 hypothetical protein [Georgenia sp. EYE_87]
MGSHPRLEHRDDVAGAAARFLVPTGPAMPQRGVPSPANGLPARVRTERPAPWWLGTHGGAGESTLAGLVPSSGAAGHAWPLPRDVDDVQPVVLVARTSLRGLESARVAATQWAAGDVLGVELLGLVLMADAPGRLPRPLRDLAHHVAGGVPRVWSVPWVEAWRSGGDAAPHALTVLRRDLTTLLPGQEA